jgi:hypothetical protein
MRRFKIKNMRLCNLTLFCVYFFIKTVLLLPGRPCQEELKTSISKNICLQYRHFYTYQGCFLTHKFFHALKITRIEYAQKYENMNMQT